MTMHHSAQTFVPAGVFAGAVTHSAGSIRAETRRDVAAREALLDAAFGPARFLKTCERLRENRLPAAAFVAEDADGRVVGTVRLWHVWAGPGRAALVLGPLAVADDMRG